MTIFARLIITSNGRLIQGLKYKKNKNNFVNISTNYIVDILNTK